MRKIWLSLLAALTFTLAAALPAFAYTTYGTTYSTKNASYTTTYKYYWSGNRWYVVKLYNAGTPTAPTTPTPPAANPGTPSTPGTGTTASLSADESYIYQQVNMERAKVGLAALQIDYRLVATARAKSNDMIVHNYFSHQSPTFGSPFDQMRAAGISYYTAGENIAGNPTAAGAMVSWMNSPGHKANILNSSFTRIGLGVVAGGPYGLMLTQQFIG